MEIKALEFSLKSFPIHYHDLPNGLIFVRKILKISSTYVTEREAELESLKTNPER